MHAVVSEGLTMTTDKVRVYLSDTGSKQEVSADFVIKLEKIAAVFSHYVLIATVTYSYADAGGGLARQLLSWAK